MANRNLKDYIFITMKGMAMGAADVVPGVSGGTIAFISGIYEELITSINAIGFDLIKILKKEGVKAVWTKVNGNFLLALFIGIFISLFSLAALVSWLLDNEPVLLWSFFFGLVAASIYFVGKEIKRWYAGTLVALVIGTFVAYFITTLPPNENVDSLPYLLLSGALAVCAMILPGISGAFILVLLGSYKTILDAVHTKNITMVLTVALGAIVGLLSFARLLKWMFKNYHNLTLALLTGFIIGSLNKIWPWKTVLETRIYGDKTVIIDANTSPFTYDGDPQILLAGAMAVVGFCLIFILEKSASKK
jgi:putative membrane protein